MREERSFSLNAFFFFEWITKITQKILLRWVLIIPHLIQIESIYFLKSLGENIKEFLCKRISTIFKRIF